MSSNTNQQDKEHQDFVRNFLPRFAANTPMKRGTNKEFFAIASLPNHVYEDVIRDCEKPEKINWTRVLNWYRKWRRHYSNYYDFLKVVSRGTLKKV